MELLPQQRLDGLVDREGGGVRVCGQVPKGGVEIRGQKTGEGRDFFIAYVAIEACCKRQVWQKNRHGATVASRHVISKCGKGDVRCRGHSESREVEVKRVGAAGKSREHF
eukprot:1153494-Pelagomonas_calceolata.AAC.4